MEMERQWYRGIDGKDKLTKCYIWWLSVLLLISWWMQIKTKYCLKAINLWNFLYWTIHIGDDVETLILLSMSGKNLYWYICYGK